MANTTKGGRFGRKQKQPEGVASVPPELVEAQKLLATACFVAFGTDHGERVMADLEGRYVNMPHKVLPNLSGSESALYMSGSRDVVLLLKALIAQGRDYAG